MAFFNIEKHLGEKWRHPLKTATLEIKAGAWKLLLIHPVSVGFTDTQHL